MSLQRMNRLLLILALLFWILVLFFRTSFNSTKQHVVEFPKLRESSLRVPIPHRFENLSLELITQDARHPNLKLEETAFLSPEVHHTTPGTRIPPALLILAQCHRAPNQFTNHLRLPNTLFNISMVAKYGAFGEMRKFWNPTILALPSWAINEYLIVSMVFLKDQGYRQNVLCEANICYPKSQQNLNKRERHRICSEDDIELLGLNGGLRCALPPTEVDIPSTPAQKCEGLEKGLADIPGFHDPRAFYSGRGEPLLMVVSQSQYACIGLWIVDLRTLLPSLEKTFASSPKRLGPGPLKSYSSLTELTRNPASTRRSYEKNWVIFSPSSTESYLQYELTSSKRTVSQLIGGGLTTPNITSHDEEPCLRSELTEKGSTNHFIGSSMWHQATPALKLVMCNRSNLTCHDKSRQSAVFFAAIHRKHLNGYDLPIRYERYFAVWSTQPSFNMLAVSEFPILFSQETASGWNETENWDDNDTTNGNRGFWARLTYTTTIAWAWRAGDGDVREKGVGYLDDEVILSIGVDDQDQVYAFATPSELLQCLRICPALQ